MDKKVIEELFNKENDLMVELAIAERKLQAMHDKVLELRRDKHTVGSTIAKGIGARQMTGNASVKQIAFLASLLQASTGISFSDGALKKLSMVEAQVLIKALKAESDVAKGKITQEEYDAEISDEFYRYFQLLFGKVNRLQEGQIKAATQTRKRPMTYAERIRAHIEESKS